MMIGLLQHDPAFTPRNSPRYGVRIIEPILDAMGIPHHLINEEPDVAKIKPAIDDAYAIQKAWVAMKVAQGRIVKGHKIGLTSRAMQSAVGIDEPRQAAKTADP